MCSELQITQVSTDCILGAIKTSFWRKHGYVFVYYIKGLDYRDISILKFTIHIRYFVIQAPVIYAETKE